MSTCRQLPQRKLTTECAVSIRTAMQCSTYSSSSDLLVQNVFSLLLEKGYACVRSVHLHLFAVRKFMWMLASTPSSLQPTHPHTNMHTHAHRCMERLESLLPESTASIDVFKVCATNKVGKKEREIEIEKESVRVRGVMSSLTCKDTRTCTSTNGNTYNYACLSCYFLISTLLQEYCTSLLDVATSTGV